MSTETITTVPATDIEAITALTDARAVTDYDGRNGDGPCLALIGNSTRIIYAIGRHYGAADEGEELMIALQVDDHGPAQEVVYFPGFRFDAPAPLVEGAVERPEGARYDVDGFMLGDEDDDTFEDDED